MYKDKPAPTAKPDSEYPDWMWNLDVQRHSFLELKSADWDKLSLSDKARYFRLYRREKILRANALKKKS